MAGATSGTPTLTTNLPAHWHTGTEEDADTEAGEPAPLARPARDEPRVYARADNPQRRWSLEDGRRRRRVLRARGRGAPRHSRRALRLASIQDQPCLPLRHGGESLQGILGRVVKHSHRGREEGRRGRPGYGGRSHAALAGPCPLWPNRSGQGLVIASGSMLSRLAGKGVLERVGGNGSGAKLYAVRPASSEPPSPGRRRARAKATAPPPTVQGPPGWRPLGKVIRTARESRGSLRPTSRARPASGPPTSGRSSSGLASRASTSSAP